jgi:hypothetical protein
MPDIEWNEAAQLEVLGQGIPEELKDSLQHCDIPSDLIKFVKICTKCVLQIWARAAKRKSRRWTAGSKKYETTSNTTSTPEAIHAGTVAGYFSPGPMDLSAITGRKITLEERMC